MEEYVNLIINNDLLKILLLLIVMDIIFGVLCSIRKRKICSTIGIDGIIRKMGMIISILFFLMIDYILGVNLIGFLPDSLLEYLNWDKVGIASLCNLMFIVFELLSVFKNMVNCNIPVLKKFQIFLKQVLDEFTTENKKV